MLYDASFFDRPIDRQGTDCEKWDCLSQREGRELLPMWVADMDFRCAPEIVSAIEKRAAHPVYGYTEQSDAATDAMLGFMKRRHGLAITREEQGLLPCVVTGLRAAVQAFSKPGEKVIIQPPVYGPFGASVRENDRVMAECSLLRDAQGRYTMDLESVERQCQAGAKLMLLCNPHNPVGRLWTREELSALLELLRRYDVVLVSDEIHEDFVYPGETFVPMLSLASKGDRVIAMTSASKTFNLAGLQQAFYYTRIPALKDALEDVMRRAGVTQGNIFALEASRAAYEQGDAWLDGLLGYLDSARALLVSEVAQRLPKAVLTPLEATYLAWLDLRAYGLSTEELMRRTYAQGVAFTPGTFFGEQTGEGFLRVNLACPHSQTQEAMKRLQKALEK